MKKELLVFLTPQLHAATYVQILRDCSIIVCVCVCARVCGIICIAVRPSDPRCSLGVIDSYLCTWFEHFGADFVFHSVVNCPLLLVVNSVRHILINDCL